MKKASKLPHWPPRLPGLQRWRRWRIVPKLLFLLMTSAICTAVLFFHLDYYQFDSRLEQFRVGQPAPRDVTANRTLQWEDTEKTQRKREEAASQVPSVFIDNPQALANARATVDELFLMLRSDTPPRTTQDAHAGGTIRPLPADIATIAHEVDDATWERLHASARQNIEIVMQAHIEEGKGEEVARQRLEDLANTAVADPQSRHLLTVVTSAALQPTAIIDVELTAQRRREARETVQAESHTALSGDILIAKGQLLSEGDLHQLKANQLLIPAPIARILPLAAIVLFAFASLGIYLRKFIPAVYGNNRKLSLLAGLIAATLWAAIVLKGDHEYMIGLMVIPAGSMAIAGLLGAPVAIVTTMLLSITAGLVADRQFAFILLTTGGALTGIMAVSSIWPASRALPAVLAMFTVNLVLLLSLSSVLPGGGVLTLPDLARMALEGGAGALGATFIAVGAIYILARPFGITTHYRLMELSNPNEPLLRRMMTEAPGSYHSSVMVANIAEAAADAVGADALLTRVSALYHDIGKLKRPGFFVENQAPLGIENMHQRLSPKLSYLILTSHVKEGVEIAREYKLPEEVQSIIREHHGTTLAAYFYHRAVSEAGGGEVAEHEFRYPGPKPSTREAAIVMLADSVQASVKSLKEPTPSRIENMVEDIINNRLNDGQLEDCDVTLRDLRILRDVLIRILSGLYTYTRIEYPEMKNEGARIRANLNSETTSPASEPTAAAPGS